MCSNTNAGTLGNLMNTTAAQLCKNQLVSTTLFKRVYDLVTLYQNTLNWQGNATRKKWDNSP